MRFKVMLLIMLFCSLSLAAQAAENQPTIGGDTGRVAQFMQTRGAVVVALVGDPSLLKAAGLSEIAANDQVEITNLGGDRFRLVDLKRGRQIVASCRAWMALFN